LYVPNVGSFADPSGFVELAVKAEANGWDGLFVWDMLTSVLGDGDDRRVIDPWVALAGAAARTERIKLGPMVTPLARRRPRKIALETATLAQLSGGRLVFGSGLGDKPEAEFEQFGDDPDPRARAATLDAALEKVAATWAQAGLEIPIWVAGKWPAKPPARRAARWDGMFPLRKGGPTLSVEECAEITDFIVRNRTADRPFDLVLAARERTLAPDPDLVTAYSAAGATWWVEMFLPGEGLHAVLARASQPPQNA
jgi:alkanesulfonate monooxygenase SsuD/methylene tetrahydromethanopterin reductase-like flavin-dependent oxidoreductase (luciferase family)